MSQIFGSSRELVGFLPFGILFTYTARFIGLPLDTVRGQAWTTVNLNLVGHVVSG